MSERCLVVLGMHRSGTSCLTGMIEQCGVNLGEVFTENPFNRKGNRESAKVQVLNNDVLALNGGGWNHPVTVESWNEDLCARRDEILEELKSGAASWWGFKDPRVMFTLPFWLDAIDEPSFIATFRHPYRVALSLQSRDRTSLEEGYALWLEYNMKLLEWEERFHFDLVDFDVPDDVYGTEVAARISKLGLNGLEAMDFFDASLRHQFTEPTGGIDLPEEVEKVYQALKDQHALL